METPTQDLRLGKITSQWAENNHLHVTYSTQMGSTNDRAKKEAFEEALLEEALALYVTDHQTAGRGRNTNKWNSPAVGQSLLSSWSYLIAAQPQPTLSPMIGLAVYRALSTTWPFVGWNLKAPNDIYVDDKKVAGILIENIVQGDETRVIVGLGLNVFSSPSDVEIATSVAEALPPGVPLLGQDYTAFLDRLLFEMTDAISHCEEPLSPTDQVSLLMALNKHPLLSESYDLIKGDGTLVTKTKSLHWSQL